MIIQFLSFLATFLLFAGPGESFGKDGYLRNPNADVVHYCFSITLNDSTNRIEGTSKISLNIKNAGKFIEFDLAGVNQEGKGMIIASIKTGIQILNWKHLHDRVEIEIPDSLQRPGMLSLSISYSGIPIDGLIISKNKFGDRTFFADNWPNRAHHWIPCMDHPYDKATVEFIVTAPEKYKVVSNGYLFSEYPLEGSFGNRVKVSHWVENVPVPTKVMVIGVADFAWTTSGFSKEIPVQTWVYSQNRENGFKDYQPAAGILTFYQDLIGPFSYEKLANVQSKTMFGGMENSGCIFYYEKSVTGKNQLHSLLAHEIAHQWFGDAVTENDWHEVWLSEGFATYLEACYADSLLAGRKLSASMADMRKSVIRYYEETHKPVVDTTITNLMDLLSTNSYDKGAWVLHMLRQELGDKIFWTGMRNYYSVYRDKNATTADFQAVMENVSGKSLSRFFHQWLEIPGQPEIEGSWKFNKIKNQVEIDIQQVQNQPVFDFTLPLELIGESIGKDTLKPVQQWYCKVPIHERKEHFILPVAFPISKIRFDPFIQLLFQEKKVVGL